MNVAADCHFHIIDHQRFPFEPGIGYTLENRIWGSDWPFIKLSLKPSYPQTLACLTRWVPDESRRRTILWETPARLLGFKP